MLRVITVGFAGCLGSGCFSTPAIYPEHWAEPVTVDGRACPSIDGLYANSGESRWTHDSDGQEIYGARSLAHILNGGTGVDSLALWNKLGDSFENAHRDPNVSIRLSVGDGRLQATATHADGSSRSMEMPVRPDCRDGLIALEGDWDTDLWLIAPVAPEFSRKSIELGRATDGALLVRESKTAVQWYLITPAFGYREADWIRFAELPVSTAAVSEVSP
jgi:hypothetical protein